MTPQPSVDEDAQVIHLPLVIPPVRQLLAFYDHFLAGDDPAIEQLDEAVVELKALPDIPGRLGRDIALIADGGRGATRNEIVGSLERLRQVAAMDPPLPQHQTAHARRTRAQTKKKKKKKKTTAQATLPGMA